KSMCQFMADRPAGIPVIWRRTQFRIEERGLQHASGEINVVHLRIVLRIYCRRTHAPLSTVHWLANFVDAPLVFELAGAFYVSCKIISLDFQRAVIAPFIRIADLVPDTMQLFEGL